MTQYIEAFAWPLLPVWDSSIPDLPPRSRLYNLVPLGLNSSLVESLTSYICRLAFEHHLQVGTLIQYIIAPVIRKRYIADGQSRSISSFMRYADPINGNGIMATDWVSALESLTLRADLAFLTLLVGADVLSQRNLLQPFRQWCPMCLDGWRRQGGVVYEPLLWSINGVTACPEHYRLLERLCPHCSSPLRWFEWSSHPGYCSFCGRWLGGAESKSEAAEERDIYVAKTVGSFLAYAPNMPFSTPRAYFIQSFRDLIAATTDDNIAAFSRYVGLPRTSVWELVQGYFPPSFPFLLQLCYQFHLSLLQLLTGVEIIAPSAMKASLTVAHKHDVRRPFDHKSVQQALEDILADRHSTFLSMREVARRLGYPARTIETHFPVQCREISRRYSEYRQQRALLRKAQLRQRIRGAASIVLSQGLNPTYQRVGRRLGEPGCFREFEARRALLEIRSQTIKEVQRIEDL